MDSIVLVGLANGREELQEDLGTVSLLSGREGENILNLRHEGVNHRLEVVKVKQGSYTVTIPEWGHNVGIWIRLDPYKKENGFYFSTGLNCHDSGTCGPIVFGADKVVELFGRIFE